MIEAYKFYRLNESWEWEVAEGGLPSLAVGDVFYMEDEDGSVITSFKYGEEFDIFYISSKDAEDETQVYVQPAVVGSVSNE